MRVHMEKTDVHKWGKNPLLWWRTVNECLSNRKDTLKHTLKGRRNRSGELEARIDSGAYASAVVRAATLIGP